MFRTPATDNSWISIDDVEAKAFLRQRCLWLMTNQSSKMVSSGVRGGRTQATRSMTVMTGTTSAVIASLSAPTELQQSARLSPTR
jgi:hypothetical protein